MCFQVWVRVPIREGLTKQLGNTSPLYYVHYYSCMRHDTKATRISSVKLEGSTTESPNLLGALPGERTGTPAVTAGGGVWCLGSAHCGEPPVVGQLRPGSPGVQVGHFITRIQTKYLNDKCSNREFSALSFLDQPNQERCSSREQTQKLLA